MSVTSSSAGPRQRQRADFFTALFFLGPNFLGFACFVAFPVVFGLAMAFTNWTIFKDDPVRFVGLSNFAAVLRDPKFYFYLANTLYLMLGIPLGIAASVILALVLSQPIGIRTWRSRILISVVVMVTSLLTLLTGLLALGRVPGWLWILASLTAVVGLLAVFAGVVAFRTFFYLPSITSGVAMMLLWKNLYRSQGGPINESLTALFGWMESVARVVPPVVFHIAAGAVAVGAMALVIRLLRGAVSGRYNARESGVGLVAVLGAIAVTVFYTPTGIWFATAPLAVAGAALLGCTLKFVSRYQFDRISDSFFAALFGTAMACFGLGLLAALLIVWARFPQYAAQPPQWLESPRNLLGYSLEGTRLVVQARSWGVGAREALILMGLWTSMGGNTMLLYLAGLSNVPPELYEAADIDGAGRWQRFWAVTWPQLAPTTFFVVIMSVIGGLQSGFEQARVMTQGKPEETTITIAYYINVKAFEQYQLGYAAAISWILFLIIFAMTMVNWRFGNRAVND